MKRNPKKRRKVYVFADWYQLGSPKLMGVLYAELLRGKEIFSFEYDNTWLKTDYAQVIDPDLGLFEGIQFLSDKKPNFGVFLDSSPDRWGRLLMKKRESAYSRKEKRTENNLYETDFLLGVSDQLRMGAIRFKEDTEGAFLSDDKKMSIPAWSSLPNLQEIAKRIQDDDYKDEDEYINWLNLLVNPGSSIGGARPKSGVMDENSELWIAKFPAKNDIYDYGAWEYLVNILAKNSDLLMPEFMSKVFTGNKHTFLSKRFDRKSVTKRIHFASAMTLLGSSDGADFNTGSSYLDIAEFIIRNSSDVKADLEELWRRIVFSIAVSNTDDHLRNHGFLLNRNGWSLSPAYDLNPDPYSTGLSLNINENNNELDVDLAFEIMEYFRLNKTRADKIILKIKNEVKQWRSIAKNLNIEREEQELMKTAFNKL